MSCCRGCLPLSICSNPVSFPSLDCAKTAALDELDRISLPVGRSGPALFLKTRCCFPPRRCDAKVRSIRENWRWIRSDAGTSLCIYVGNTCRLKIGWTAIRASLPLSLSLRLCLWAHLSALLGLLPNHSQHFFVGRADLAQKTIKNKIGGLFCALSTRPARKTCP